MGEGPTTSQPPSAGESKRERSHGRVIDALRPAWASWMAGTAPCASTNAAMRTSASRCVSFHRPRHHGVIRPRGSTCVASVNTSPAPPVARLPRCTKCQSSATPSVARVLAHRRQHDAIGKRSPNGSSGAGTDADSDRAVARGVRCRSLGLEGVRPAPASNASVRTFHTAYREPLSDTARWCSP